MTIVPPPGLSIHESFRISLRFFPPRLFAPIYRTGVRFKTMSTELWIRNPSSCIKECLEERVKNIVWDYGWIRKYSLDPVRFMDVYYPASLPWKLLVVGDTKQDVLEIHPGDTMERPTRTHRAWEYGEELMFLEEMMEKSEPGDLIVVSGIPNTHHAQGRRFVTELKHLQAEYPEATVHVHGMYSFRVLFGLGFKSVDFDPRLDAQKGNVILPVGQKMSFEQASRFPRWISLMNMAPVDLKIPRERCIFNIRAANWASVNFTRSVRWRSLTNVEVDESAYRNSDSVPEGSRIFSSNKVDKQPGDLFLCDLCSIQTMCAFFRTGSVCAVPDSEPADLARFFKSRDSDVIIEGLGTLLAAQTRRLERAMEDEEVDEHIDPHVTKIIESIFDRGVKLAKLVDPALAAAGGPKVSLRFTQNNASIQAATPQALMAGVVAELEARGVHRSKITPEMIRTLLGDREALEQNVIEASVVDSESRADED